MLIYATKADLARYVTGDPDATEDQAPVDAPKQLQSASILIRRATSRASYNTDADGYPSLSRIREAFRDATCAMASAYSTLGINVQAGPAATTQQVQSKSLGSASVSYVADPYSSAARAALATGAVLTSEAYALLRNEGLLNAALYSEGRPHDVFAPGPWPVS